MKMCRINEICKSKVAENILKAFWKFKPGEGEGVDEAIHDIIAKKKEK